MPTAPTHLQPPDLSATLSLFRTSRLHSETGKPPRGNQLGRRSRPELDCSWHQQSWLRDDAIGVLDPFARPSPSVARIDHLFDLEPVERTDRPPRAFDARVDLGSQRCGVCGIGQLAFIGGFDPALGRDAANVRCRPRDARTGAAARRREVIARDPKAPSHNYGEDRYRYLRECNHPLAAFANRAGDLV